MLVYNRIRCMGYPYIQSFTYLCPLPFVLLAYV